MKRGDMVMIYREPLLRQEPIGTAKLIRMTGRIGAVERWLVQFEGEFARFEHDILDSNTPAIEP
jgi:hypothetical protein